MNDILNSSQVEMILPTDNFKENGKERRDEI